MIDIHCHILYDIDDGAKSLEESIEMAKVAYEDGIKTIVNTSHYHPSFEYKTGNELIKRVEEFNEELKQRNIHLEVLIGNELYYTSDILENLGEMDFFTINDSRYVLVEFPPTNFPKNICDVVYEIKLKGYTPILAHVERYKEVRQEPNLIYDCIQEGALIQINASSILGKGGSEIKNIVDILLDNNMVDAVGSDGHGSKSRRPLMKESYEYVYKKYGKDTAQRLFISNNESIISNKEVHNQDATMYIEKKSFFRKIFGK